MTERLQNILNEINNGTRTHIYDLNLNKEELLTKDSNGVYFIEYLLQKDIPLYSVEDKIENDAKVAYLLCKHDSIMLYTYKIDEKTLFSLVNGKRIIDYIIEKDKINDNILNSITDNIEIVDLICRSNKQYHLSHLSPEIINKLMTKDNSDTYPIEKYLNDNINHHNHSKNI